jgi:hypothetical protein
MNCLFTKNIENPSQTCKNHLACVKIQHVSKIQLSTAAICTATSPPTVTQKCSCRCTLLHTRRSAAHHIHCPLLHVHWLPAIHCDRAPACQCLRIQQCTLLAATPTPPLLHTAARTPLPPLLLLPPLPPPPLLVRLLLIA